MLCAIEQSPGNIPLVKKPLFDCAPHPVFRAGIVPFFFTTTAGAVEYLLYRPEAVHRDLPPPVLQICKGTRKLREPSQEWRDASERDFPDKEPYMEPLTGTALREGREEIGLEPENIVELMDLGVAGYASERTGKPKSMQLFACRIKSKEAFSCPSPQESNTAERRWLDASQFARMVRKDHIPLLNALNAVLTGTSS